HVPVVWVGKRQPLLPTLVTAHPAAEDVPVHQPTGSSQVREGDVGPLSSDGSYPLPLNATRPFHPQEALPSAVDRQPDEKIPKEGRVQHASVVNGDQQVHGASLSLPWRAA